MKQSIYTIPISEAFEKLEGCPLCDLRKGLERHWVEYVTGPAMMEPDVREETNRLGFCRKHYDDTLKCRNRLSVALMLQTRLDELIRFRDDKKGTGIFAKKTENSSNTCFICNYFGREFDRILGNIAAVWARDDEFKKMYMQQKYVCSKDLTLIFKAADKTLRGKKLKAFRTASRQLWEKRAVALKSDIDAFCGLYDYRNANSEAPSGEISSAIERAVSFLSPD